MTGWVLALILAAPAPPSAAEAVERFHADPTTAVESLKEAAHKHSQIAPALNVLRAEALLESNQASAAFELASSILKAGQWSNRARWIAGRAVLGSDCTQAQRLLLATTVDPPWIDGAERLKVIADAESKCGASSATTRRRLNIEFPYTQSGQAAGKGLTLSPEETLEQAAAFERAREYSAAERVLRSLLRGRLSVEARFRLGRLYLDRLRTDFEQAGAFFLAVAKTKHPLAEEARYLVARTRGRGGDTAGAMAAYAAYQRRYPRGKYGGDARFFAAFLSYETGEYAVAGKAFATIKQGKWRRAARWYHAWSSYLAGAQNAASLLVAIADRESANSRPQRRASYWAARALERTDPKSAAARRKALVTTQPHDWYGILTRRRFPKEFGTVAGIDTPPTRPDATAPPALQADVAHIRALAASDLPDFARRALAKASPRLLTAGASAVIRVLGREIGDPERVYRQAVRSHGRLLLKAPVAKDAQIWRDAYPPGFPIKVAAAARRHRVPPTLVYSFIRKESAFDVEAVSHAHAVGLMQLLPKTAQKIQKKTAQVGTVSTRGNLFVPAVNIDLGTWYISALKARFGDQLPLVAAAYNAGPQAVQSWFGVRKQVDTDIFVETIPFKETRGYVKLLARAWVAYRMVHLGLDLDTAAKVVPLRLDLTPRSGVDF